MDEKKKNVAQRMEQLSRELLYHQYLYYVRAQPEIGDQEYDRLFDELQALEQQYPDLVQPDSPTQRVGSDLEHDLPEVEHSIPVLSLDKAYSGAGVREWLEKTVKNSGSTVSVVVEEKIDGSSIVLYYQAGGLLRAVTRGNGAVGNDITDNVKTIAAVPLRLSEPVDVVVRGEIFLPRAAFETYNQAAGGIYANPRNLAAGTLRSVRSSSVAKLPLDIFVYEGFFTLEEAAPEGSGAGKREGEADQDHVSILNRLGELGFKLDPRTAFFSSDREQVARVQATHPHWSCGLFEELDSYLEQAARERDGLPYEIDGLVLKVNEIPLREQLGYTAHHPRWAIAYKFESPQAVTTLRDVTPQVGRNGRITPVAELEPVKLAGSTISRATLHNQIYIDLLELAIGDTVAISKRGDVIPAVEKVVEPNKNGNTTWKLPPHCPSCSSTLVQDGAHHFCRNRDCPGRMKGALTHFCSKAGLDIEGLGEKTVAFLYDKGLVRRPADLYGCDYTQLASEEGFGDKKIALIQTGLEESKQRPFHTVLAALGVEGLGKRAAEQLVAGGFDSMEKILAAADSDDWQAFAAVEGFAETMGRQLVAEFTDQINREQITGLQAAGLQMAAHSDTGANLPQTMAGQSWCVTGSFEHFQPRDKAMEEVKKRGGRVVSSVSSKTTHLLAGPGAGSKLDKAKQLGVEVVDEEAFLGMLE